MTRVIFFNKKADNTRQTVINVNDFYICAYVDQLCTLLISYTTNLATKLFLFFIILYNLQCYTVNRAFKQSIVKFIF